MHSIPARSARLNARKNPFGTWQGAVERLAPEAWPNLNPAFGIRYGGKIFTIGSCFARNIEEHLDRLGYDVPTLRFSVPKEESGAARANAILNKYTPAAIWQEIEWAAGIYSRGDAVTMADCERFAFRADDRIIDTNLGGGVPVTAERFLERRQSVYDTFAHVFSADCVTLTLGLVEAWFDLENEVYVQRPPVTKAFIRQLDRFEFRVLGYQESVDYVQSTIDLVRHHNPEARFLITTSPIPLARTFTEDDVITANSNAKCLLRTVCGHIAATNEQVDYFPSFESVILTNDWSIWARDRRHVSDAFVGRIVQRLVDAYFGQTDESRRLYQQAYTLHKNGEHEAACEMIETALADDPDNPDWRRLQAEAQLKSGDLAAARESIGKAIDLDPGSADNHAVHASICIEAGDTGSARTAIEEAIRLAPRKPRFHYTLAEILEASGDSDTALVHTRRGASLQPKYWKAHLRLSKALEACGLHAEALDSAQLALKLGTPSPWLHRRIARLLIQVGNPGKARKHAEAAREMAPDKKRQHFCKSIDALLAQIDAAQGRAPA